VHRLLVVGGAGSLRAASDGDRVDSEDLPEMYRAEALAQREVLGLLRGQVTDLSAEDYAVALVDEAERSTPIRRSTVAY
jgi:uncharacterized protein